MLSFKLLANCLNKSSELNRMKMMHQCTFFLKFEETFENLIRWYIHTTYLHLGCTLNQASSNMKKSPAWDNKMQQIECHLVIFSQTEINRSSIWRDGSINQLPSLWCSSWTLTLKLEQYHTNITQQSMWNPNSVP